MLHRDTFTGEATLDVLPEDLVCDAAVPFVAHAVFGEVGSATGLTKLCDEIVFSVHLEINAIVPSNPALAKYEGEVWAATQLYSGTSADSDNLLIFG